MRQNTAASPQQRRWSDWSILKTIPSPTSHTYRIRIENPEVTFLGMERQPDFGRFVIEYVPNARVLELKSLKLYFFQFRERLLSYERLVNVVFHDLLSIARPRELQVTATFNPRGGMTSTVFVSSSDVVRKQVRQASHHLLPEQQGRYAGLTAKQRKVFEEIEQIRGTHSKARKQVEGLLRKLKDDPVNEALTDALKALLKGRGWGIQCMCGEAGAPLWARHPRYKEGGYMQLTHRPSEGTLSLRDHHGYYTKVPALEVVNRVDLRRQRRSRREARR